MPQLCLKSPITRQRVVAMLLSTNLLSQRSALNDQLPTLPESPVPSPSTFTLSTVLRSVPRKPLGKFVDKRDLALQQDGAGSPRTSAPALSEVHHNYLSSRYSAVGTTSSSSSCSTLADVVPLPQRPSLPMPSTTSTRHLPSRLVAYNHTHREVHTWPRDRQDL
jgi:hypothetical protein